MFMKKKPLSTNSTTVCLLCFKPICMVLTFPIIFDGLLYRFDRGWLIDSDKVVAAKIEAE